MVTSQSNIIENNGPPTEITTNQVTYNDPRNGQFKLTSNSTSLKPKMSDTQIIALSGALAGFIAGVSVCPLDVAKTRLQAQGLTNSQKYKGITGTLTTILKDEGYKGLYRGLIPIVLGYFPTWMIYFSVYEKAKKVYPNLAKNYYGDNYSEFLIHSLSAFTAGSVSTSITNPIWVVKTRLMLQTGDGKTSFQSLSGGNQKNYYKNTLDAFKKMYKNEGFLVFYSGLIPSLFGLFHVAIHFPVYEKLKKFLHCDNFQHDQQKDSTHFSNLSRLITASSLSKMCASTLTYPHEILRTRMQISSLSITKSNLTKHNLLHTILYIYKKEGLIGFYSGFTTNLARTVPASAVTLVSFEYISKYLGKALK